MRRKAVACLLRQLAQREATGSSITSTSTSRAQRSLTSSPRAGYKQFAEPPPTYVPTAEEAAAISRRNALLAGALLLASGGAYLSAISKATTPATIKPPREEHLVNWSGTHECTVAKFYQPETLSELEALVQEAHELGHKLRCVGSGLSPNALSFQEQGMVSLALMDKVLMIDEAKQQVTVQAGARVQEVADALRRHGLTLQNYASIREQTIGGFIQVSAHGTGAAIPPVDDTVVGLKLVTPARGTIYVTKASDPELFSLAKVGLGCLGVVAEVTLQCVPAHRLVERTFVTNAAEVKKRHAEWVTGNKHLRYMWIPSTDAVVVVQCNEEGSPAATAAAAAGTATTGSSSGEGDAGQEHPHEERMEQLRALVRRSRAVPAEEVDGLSATQCRDALLAVNPLDAAWVAKVNVAEAEYWRRSAGTRVGWSDEILGFDCGGQQWVLEVAFPAGSLHAPSGADLRYMDELLTVIKRHGIAAPAPIEQRWSRGSSSGMSPAAGPPESLHSWVGIIMYLPEDEESRKKITAAFREYARVEGKALFGKYGAVEHWAKIEVPEREEELQAMRRRLAGRYPLQAFHEARKRLDPNGILGNDLVDTLLTPEQ